MSDKSSPRIGCGTMLIGGIMFIVALILALMGREGCGPCVMSRKVSGRVVDEHGQPVPGVEIKLRWSTGRDLLGSSSGQSETVLTSESDGRFPGRGDGFYFDLYAKKEGYYPSFLSMPRDFGSDALVITLNTIRHPQAMVGKHVHLRVPIGTSHLEYDFLKGDCLPPLGNGVVADLEIEWTRPKIVGAEACRNAFKTQVRGLGNGVAPPAPPPLPGGVASRLRSHYEAPLDGYHPNCDFGNHFRGGMLVAYLKIRADRPDGPLFGKLLDPISYWADGEYDRFEFVYVINPSGSRGLEMDMKRITVPSRKEPEYAPAEF